MGIAARAVRYANRIATIHSHRIELPISVTRRGEHDTLPIGGPLRPCAAIDGMRQLLLSFTVRRHDPQLEHARAVRVKRNAFAVRRPRRFKARAVVGSEGRDV